MVSDTREGKVRIHHLEQGDLEPGAERWTYVGTLATRGIPLLQWCLRELRSVSPRLYGCGLWTSSVQVVFSAVAACSRSQTWW